MTRSVPAPVQTHIRSPSRTAAPISRVRAAMAQENETILELGVEEPNRTSVRPPGSARICRSWKITKYSLRARRDLHHSALDNDTEGDIFPERDQELSGQGDDRRLLQTTAIAQDAFFKPQRERRLRLMTQP
jgi:hypothetical protein